ncbi:MAG: hypothetical protein ACO3NJ_06655 [Candidatus Poseidoniaceae archaeon]
MFRDILAQRQGWYNLKGYTCFDPITGYRIESSTPTYKSDWWRYKRTITDTEETYLQLSPASELVKIVVLSTPPEYRGKGLAKTALIDLMEMVGEFDQYLKGIDGWDLSYSIMLVPNPVDVMGIPPRPPRGNPDGEPDWTSGFEEYFEDESFRELGRYSDKPMDLNQLIAFYKRLGFVESDRLKYVLRNGEWFYNMCGRSFSINRPCLMWPEVNIERAIVRA